MNLERIYFQFVPPVRWFDILFKSWIDWTLCHFFMYFKLEHLVMCLRGNKNYWSIIITLGSRLLKDNVFVTKMTSSKKRACSVSETLLNNFWGTLHWKKVVLTMIDSFQKLRCSTSLKLHFVDSHVEYFLENFGDYSEEQFKRFH